MLSDDRSLIDQGILFQYKMKTETIVEWVARRMFEVLFCSCNLSAIQFTIHSNQSLIKHAQYLNPEKRSDSNSISAISNLCLTVGNCLKNVIQNVFKLNQGELVEEHFDNVGTQWKIYQCESISLFQEPESVSVTEPKSTPNSYWKAAFHAFVIETTKDETTNLKQIDEYSKSVGKMKDESRQLKFSHLFALVRCLMSISHGKSIPEWGFSINKYLLSIHVTSSSNETIIALHLVKDHLILIGGYMKFSISRNLILSVKMAWQKYRQDIEAKRLLREKESERIKLADIMKEKNELLEEKLSNIEVEIKRRKVVFLLQKSVFKRKMRNCKTS